MDVKCLLDKYFQTSIDQVGIDAFDAKNIYLVYERVIKTLTKQIDIETTVLQAMSYCFYEILDNVLTHSGKDLGIVITHYNIEANTLQFLIADDGIGIKQSLSQNEKYKMISEEEALRVCINDSVTDGKGMGFGLYSTYRLATNIALAFEIHSGSHRWRLQNGEGCVDNADFWQGTIVFIELTTNQEINPSDVVLHRTNIVEQYNEAFLTNSEIENLW